MPGRQLVGIGGGGPAPTATRTDRVHSNVMRRLRQPLVWIAALMLLAAGCGQGAEAPATPAPPPRGDGHTVSGAGATFPAPIYEQWFEHFPRTTVGAGTQVRYEAVGSGKGITAFTERRVDFGATDIP
jgi:phosphate transport system substrate-binding protein